MACLRDYSCCGPTSTAHTDLWTRHDTSVEAAFRWTKIIHMCDALQRHLVVEEELATNGCYVVVPFSCASSCVCSPERYFAPLVWSGSRLHFQHIPYLGSERRASGLYLLSTGPSWSPSSRLWSGTPPCRPSRRCWHWRCRPAPAPRPRPPRASTRRRGTATSGTNR
jgi:hypothetical protein